MNSHPCQQEQLNIESSVWGSAECTAEPVLPDQNQDQYSGTLTGWEHPRSPAGSVRRAELSPVDEDSVGDFEGSDDWLRAPERRGDPETEEQLDSTSTPDLALQGNLATVAETELYPESEEEGLLRDSVDRVIKHWSILSPIEIDSKSVDQLVACSDSLNESFAQHQKTCGACSLMHYCDDSFMCWQLR